MSEPEIGAGDVPITLGGEDRLLSPSLQACLNLTKLAGPDGLMGLVNRLSRYEFDVLVQVIAAGLGFAGQGPKELTGLVYDGGLHKMVPLAIRFVNHVMNGGRPVADVDDSPGGNDPAPLGSKSPPLNTSTPSLQSQPDA